MNLEFLRIMEEVDIKVEQLISMTPVVISSLPKVVPKAGIYLLSEGNDHLYVGRSNRIRGRLRNHSRLSANHNQASFAFLLAREATGNLQAAYSRSGSREALMRNPGFRTAFQKAKER